MTTQFLVDDILYTRPDNRGGPQSVYIRQMIQIFDGDQRLAPMHVHGNKPKLGLMDSEIDEEYLKEYWE